MIKFGKRLAGVFALGMFSSVLAGCVSESSDSPAKMAELRQKVDQLPPNYFSASTSKTVSASQFRNKTVRSSSADIGTQVEYMAADGQSYLWISGNRKLLTGTWSVADSGHLVCFQYGSKPHCQFAGSFLSMIDEKVSGDVFGIGRGAMPFKLPYGRFSIAEIKRMQGT